MLKPMGKRVVIRLEDAEMKSAGGIIIPQTASQKKTDQGTIVALGPECSKELAVGMKVITEAYAGMPFKQPGDPASYMIVLDNTVVGTIAE